MRALLLAGVLLACRSAPAIDPSLHAARSGGALAVSDALEVLVEEDRATQRDSDHARTVVATMPDDQSAGFAYARAATSGRAAERLGLRALSLVREAEAWARRSIERDPKFRAGAARRMHATIHVLAAAHLEHGDSEAGLEVLEALVEEYPEQWVNSLRLGEAYVALGDPESAVPFLCRVQPNASQLGREDHRLLKRLIEDMPGGLTCSAP